MRLLLFVSLQKMFQFIELDLLWTQSKEDDFLLGLLSALVFLQVLHQFHCGKFVLFLLKCQFAEINLPFSLKSCEFWSACLMSTVNTLLLSDNKH